MNKERKRRREAGEPALNSWDVEEFLGMDNEERKVVKREDGTYTWQDGSAVDPILLEKIILDRGVQNQSQDGEGSSSEDAEDESDVAEDSSDIESEEQKRAVRQAAGNEPR